MLSVASPSIKLAIWKVANANWDPMVTMGVLLHRVKFPGLQNGVERLVAAFTGIS